VANLSTYPSKRFNSFCYDDDDDDEDYTIAVTPSLSTEEPDNSLSEHLNTIPATESDEFIKSSVENLIPIPSESEGIPDNISEVMEIVIPKEGGIDDDILLTIKDDILREKLLNINLFIANIEALNDNPTPSFDFMTNSSSTSLNSLLEETNTFDNSLPEFETFCFDVKSDSSDDQLSSDKEIVSKPLSEEEIIPMESLQPQVLHTLPTHPTLQLNLKFQPSSESLFAYVVWIFLPFLVYSVVPCYLLSLRNEDIIFDPGICNSHFYRPDISHRCRTVKKFNTHRSHLNEYPMMINGKNIPLLDVPLLHFYPP
nr:hypothetical protein [Tanacetum cinerariifolium]